MKITKRQLRRIIREEKQKLNEAMSTSMLTKQQITEVLFQQFAMHMLGQTDFADDGITNKPNPICTTFHTSSFVKVAITYLLK